LDPIKTIRLAEKVLAENFAQLEETAYLNQAKVLKAFQKNQVRDYHFHTYSSGYGYNDLGREVLESIYAQVFSAPSAIVRSQYNPTAGKSQSDQFMQSCIELFRLKITIN
jgi:cystathionine beta-lyase family protein involved in aluminum resistance